ncbi:hypothetical protein [Myroides sp. TSA_177.3]|uniref:hypothetical protein n=1 Tax=Myroides sp. TSA_177.3 TaxID=3415650 RepID=UPI00404656A9
MPNITISSSFSSSQRGILIQDHVYKNASGYQYFRDGLRETQLDNLQSGLDIIGMVPIIGEPIDLINAGISYGRGRYVEGSLSLAATIPFIGVGATVSKVGVKLIGPAGDAGALVTKQIPENWIIKSAKKDAGTRYIDPSNIGNNVRVMRGNVNSPFVNSQTPYTIRYINGAPVDVHKKQILNITGKNQNRASNLHVPVNDFKF